MLYWNERDPIDAGACKLNDKKLTDEYLSDFCMQMYLMVGAGVAPGEALGLLRREERDRAAAAVLERAESAMGNGDQLHQALARTGAFPPYLTELTAVGERTGSLEAVLHTLSGHYDRQAAFADGVRSAVLYPAVLLAMMLAVIAVLLMKVLPVFENVYAQLGTVMTGPAAFFLRAGRWLGHGWPFIAAALAAVVLLVWLAARRRKRVFGSRWGFLPASLRRKIAAERFASAMSMGIRSGFDDAAAMEMAEKLCSDGETEEKIRAAREQVSAGAPLPETVEKTGLFSPMACRLLAVGARAGGLDGVFEEIAQRLARQIDDGMDGLISRMEPTMVVVLCALVGVILLSVMLPLAGLLSAMG